MKKLIPALCMLLVAACLMGTSTYAWFAANEDVTASGMQVKAAADGGLAIASWGNNTGNAVRPGTEDYKGTAAAIWTNQLSITNPTVMPTSVNPVGAGTWWTGNSDKTSTHGAVADKDGNLYTQVTNGAAYYQATKFSIRSLDASATAADGINLKLATLTVSDSVNTANLNKALRVAIYVYADPANDTDDTNDDDVPTNGAWYVFAPNSAATAFECVTGAKTDGTTTMYTGKAPAQVIYQGLTAAPIVVEVYTYYDGMDENCKSDNLSMAVDTLTVSLGFSTAK